MEYHEDYVLKIAHNTFGYRANYNESIIWKETPVVMLAEVQHHSPDYFYVRMERVDIPPLIDRIRIAHEIRKELRKIGIRINDVQWYNVGIKDGIPKLFDYGGMMFSRRVPA